MLHASSVLTSFILFILNSLKHTANVLEQQQYQRNYAQLQDMFDYTCDFSSET